MGPQVGYYIPQILMEEDLHGPGHRRSRRGLPRRQPVRRARPRTRLRVERDDLDLRQRRHVRRGPLPGRIPLPLQGPVPARWKSSYGRTAGRRTLADSTPPGIGNADRLPHRARDRLRPRQGPRQERSRSPAPAPPTSTRPTRRSASPSSTNPASSPAPSSSSTPPRTSTSCSTGPTSTRTTSPTTCPAGCPQRAAGHLARLPDPRHRSIRLAGLRTRALHTSDVAARSTAHPHAIDPAFLVSWNNKQAPGWSPRPTTSTATARSSASQLIAEQHQSRPRAAATRWTSHSSFRRWTRPPPRTSARSSCWPLLFSRRSAGQRSAGIAQRPR